ncbi:MAG: hypothetical protein L0H83_13805, partial [Salinisphaera sp.]|nr:hypothetical protein [Salinisphaera sp.]
MQAIAKNPDPERLSFSRDSNTGAPMASTADPDALPATDLGRTDTVTMPSSGRKIPVRYAVVEADSIEASHHVDGSANNAYANAGIKALNNGRVAGLKAAWQRSNGDGYRQGLIDDAEMLGLDPEAIRAKKQPVLIRMYDESLNVGDMGAESNASSNLGLSPTEQARTDARALPEFESLPVTDAGELSTNPASTFFRQFLSNLGSNETAKLVDAEGRPNKAFYDRLRGAIFAKAYGEDRLVTAMAEDAHPDGRNALNALVKAAPAWAKIDRDGPLAEYPKRIAAAFEVMRKAREAGQRVDDWLAQGDLVARDTSGDEWASFMAKHARSPNRMAEALREAARIVDAAQQHAKTGDMLGGAEPPSPAEVTRRAIDLVEQEYAKRQEAANGPDETAGQDSDSSRGRGGEPAEVERAAAGRSEGGFELAGQAQPEPSPAPEGTQQQDLIAPPTSAERIQGATKAKDAERDGRTGTGRTDMLAGDGALFAGKAPEQASVLDASSQTAAQLAASAMSAINLGADVSNAQGGATSEESAGQIEDFGEKLGGARKDQTPSLAKDLTEDDIASQPLSKIWPATEIDDITDPFAAALAHAARGEVPAKPRKGWKLRRWVEKVQSVRGLAKHAMDGTLTPQELANRKPLADFAAKVTLLQGIDRANWSRIGG